MANSKIVLAVAGSGKTESIVQRCRSTPCCRLVVTYTVNGQLELEGRLRASFSRGEIDSIPVVIGWYSFLIEYFLKPYMVASSFGRSYAGFNFEYRPGRFARGDANYFDTEGRVGREGIGYVARKVMETTEGAPVRRLESIYEEVVFDEVQDLAGSDFVILEQLLRSSLSLYIVGDPRQVVFETSSSDRKYPDYRGVGKVDWFRKQAADLKVELVEWVENRRSNEDVVDLANRIFDPSLGLAQATSAQVERDVDHSGIFRISEHELAAYIERYDPLSLRWDKRSAKKFEALAHWNNFGEVKGLESDHVVIFPTELLRTFLATGAFIEKSVSAAKCYVAITRARHSVAFVLSERASAPGLDRWQAD